MSITVTRKHHMTFTQEINFTVCQGMTGDIDSVLRMGERKNLHSTVKGSKDVSPFRTSSGLALEMLKQCFLG